MVVILVKKCFFFSIYIWLFFKLIYRFKSPLTYYNFCFESPENGDELEPRVSIFFPHSFLTKTFFFSVLGCFWALLDSDFIVCRYLRFFFSSERDEERQNRFESPSLKLFTQFYVFNWMRVYGARGNCRVARVRKKSKFVSECAQNPKQPGRFDHIVRRKRSIFRSAKHSKAFRVGPKDDEKPTKILLQRQ